MTENTAPSADLEMIEKCKDMHGRIREEVGKVIVGQHKVVDEVLMALFCNAHVLLVGVPGLAKTLLISSLAKVLDLEYRRVQFTPDLLPGDITGSEVIEENRTTGKREFRFIRGPVFTNLLLADEINRTPPKTQAALLQAMQEREVSVGQETLKLDHPFLVMATQNPIEQEGTYPLPEAQMDRFMFNTFVGYPETHELEEIVKRTTGGEFQEPEAVMSADDITRVQKVVRQIPVAEAVIKYLVRLTEATRPERDDAPDFVKKYVNWGCGPRAAQYLALGAKAHAVLQGQGHASIEGVQAVAASVLRHRIGCNFNAQADQVDSVEITRRLIDSVPVN